MLAIIKKLYYNSKFYFTLKPVKRHVKRPIEISNDCKIYIRRKRVECEYTEGY